MLKIAKMSSFSGTILRSFSPRAHKLDSTIIGGGRGGNLNLFAGSKKTERDFDDNSIVINFKAKQKRENVSFGLPFLSVNSAIRVFNTAIVLKMKWGGVGRGKKKEKTILTTICYTKKKKTTTRVPTGIITLSVRISPNKITVF